MLEPGWSESNRVQFHIIFSKQRGMCRRNPASSCRKRLVFHGSSCKISLEETRLVNGRFVCTCILSLYLVPCSFSDVHTQRANRVVWKRRCTRKCVLRQREKTLWKLYLHPCFSPHLMLPALLSDRIHWISRTQVFTLAFFCQSRIIKTPTLWFVISSNLTHLGRKDVTMATLQKFLLDYGKSLSIWH